jgi:hypothetical protein
MVGRGVASAVHSSARAEAGIPLTFDTADLLHLLWIHQAILAHRPIDRGNKGVMAALVAASHGLASDLARSGLATGAGATERERLRAALAAETVANAPAASRKILPLIRACDAEAGSRTSAHDLYLVRAPRSVRPADELFVLFGPGLGMGDEISCLQFVRHAVARFGQTRTTIFSSYPGLWTVLLPGVRSRYCWANPLRPYRSVRLAASARTALVIAIDFDGNGLHHAVLPRLPSMDVLELAMGLRRVWLRRGTDPWIDTIETSSRDDIGNYEWLSRTWAALDPAATGVEPWQPLTGRRRSRAAQTLTVLLNPLSSKPVPWGPADWTAMLGSVAKTMPSGHLLRLRVYPGVDAESAAAAAAIATAMDTLPGVEAALTHEALTSHNGLRGIAREIGHADLCVTIDTFTAHLAPLFGVPTVVMTLKENRAFWVPCPWSFYVTPADVPTLVPLLVASLLAPDRLPVRPEVQEEIRRATTQLAAAAEPAAVLGELIAALAVLVGDLDGRSPFASSGRQWLRFWSRVSAAVRRSPVAAPELAHYVDAWTGSTFYRLFAEPR